MRFPMRAALPASLALAASITLAAAGEQSPKDDQAVAAMIEWAVANCGMNTVSPLHAMMAQMITNGTDPAEMARVREMVCGKITANFATKEAACTSITAHIAGRG